MDYSHLHRFTPTGSDMKESGESYLIPITSGSRKPTESSKQKATRYLSRIIDPYAARNHWSINSVTIEPESPPWKTNARLMKTLRGMSAVTDLDAEATDKVNEFRLEIKIDNDDFKGFLRRYYKVNQLPAVTESDGNILIIRTRWSSEK